ncbi:MAG TPA: hypothetical protein VN736_14130 [Candidatus Limnocylindrales bacterium]|nr:hypothetical protein [Candidatus Limnocylindrales bacterium]
MNLPWRVACACVLTVTYACAADVVFSRRVYQERGRSYFEIWSWTPANGSLRQLTHSARDHFEPSCKTGGRIRFVSPEAWQDTAKTWEFDHGVERVVSARAPGETARAMDCAAVGTLRACGSGNSVTLTEGGRRITTVKVGEHDTGMPALEWSPDGRWLLVQKTGWETNSTSPRSDYFVVDAGGKEAIAAGSGNSAGWVPGRDAIFYSTPRDTARLPWSPKHEEWVAQLVVFDLATRKTTAVTRGLADNIDASVCR